MHLVQSAPKMTINLENVESPPNWGKIPTFVQAYIFGYLKKQDLISLEQTCKYFYGKTLALNICWKRFRIKDFPKTENFKNLPERVFYKELSTDTIYSTIYKNELVFEKVHSFTIHNPLCVKIFSPYIYWTQYGVENNVDDDSEDSEQANEVHSIYRSHLEDTEIQEYIGKGKIGNSFCLLNTDTDDHYDLYNMKTREKITTIQNENYFTEFVDFEKYFCFLHHSYVHIFQFNENKELFLIKRIEGTHLSNFVIFEDKAYANDGSRFYSFDLKTNQEQVNPSNYFNSAFIVNPHICLFRIIDNLFCLNYENQFQKIFSGTELHDITAFKNTFCFRDEIKNEKDEKINKIYIINSENLDTYLVCTINSGLYQVDFRHGYMATLNNDNFLEIWTANRDKANYLLDEILAEDKTVDEIPDDQKPSKKQKKHGS